LDGFNCTAAAACLEGYLRHALDHCVVAHASAEPGHQRLCAELKQQPLLDLGLRLGEASGAGIAAHIVRMAVACHVGMSTFSDAGVETKSTS
jgi:nicotinate-nucleotide--dimethylbenzimidazole phosphoribosyltransferase